MWGCWFLLLSYFGDESDDIENLIEEAFSGCHADLSANFDVNGLVYLSGQSWSLDVDDNDGLNAGSLLAVADDAYQIFGFSGLADEDDCLVFGYIWGLHLDWVDDVHFSEASQFFEVVLAGAGSVVARPAGEHRQEVAKLYGLHSGEVGLEGVTACCLIS
jgi:hypothetical protein